MFLMSLQYLKKEFRDEVNFLHADKHKRFLQIDIIIFGVCVTRDAKISKNNKFAISLQYLNKEVSDAVDFSHEDKT